MSLARRDIVPVDPARNAAKEDPPSRPGAQHQPPQISMDGLHEQQAHKELQTMLRNQALAIETFQSKWQMAGQGAHAFIARTRSQSEDFVRAELTAVQRFETVSNGNTMAS